MATVEYVTTAKHWLGGGDLEARLRAELREKTQRGETMHGAVRVLSPEEIARLMLGQQPKPTVAPALPPPPPVRECVHRPRRDPDGDWKCLGCGEYVDAPAEAEPPAAQVCEQPSTVKGTTKPRPNSRPRRKPFLPPETCIRLVSLHELLDLLRCEPMSVLPRHLAMALGRQEEEVLHDLGILADLGLAKQAKSGRWRATA